MDCICVSGMKFCMGWWCIGFGGVCVGYVLVVFEVM